MVSPILIGISFAVILYKVYKWIKWRPDNFPPGPPRIPLFGSYLFMLMINYFHLHKAVQFLCKMYNSKIIGLYIGPYLTVIANDHQSVKEMLNRPEFDGRPDLFVARVREPDYKSKGIFFTDTIKWKDQRRFVLRHLRDYGFGRRDKEYELELEDEMSKVIELIRNGPKYEHEKYLFEGDSILCPDIFFGAFGNSFMQTYCCERLPRSEQGVLYQAAHSALRFLKHSDDYGRIISLYPFIRYIFPNLSGFKNLREGSMGIHSYIKSIIDREIKTYDENNTRHIIDMYIKEMGDPKRQADITNNFLYDNLVMMFTDFSIPVQGAIGYQLSFLFQRLLRHPDILKRIQDEIDSNIGTGRLPTMDDRQNLHFTEASIREIMRHETLIPSSLPHLALESAEFMGYHIPKGTIMMPGLDSFHCSDEVWGDAYAFRPDRFLDENGKLSLKLDVSLPFGAGKRLCAGETFARNMLFLYTTGILQNFTIKKSATAKYIDESHNRTGIFRYVGSGGLRIQFVPR